MKTIVKTNTVIEGNKITITGELMDAKFPEVVARRMSVGHFVSTNPHRPRHCRATNHAFMVERNGAEGFAFPLDEFVAVALSVDPKLSDAPLIHGHPNAINDILECKSETATTTVWQQSTDGKEWQDIADEQLKSFMPLAGGLYRAKVTNDSGTSFSRVISIPNAKEEK